MNLLITGSLGLVGSTATEYFLNKNHSITGIDNDMRAVFFGNDGSTTTQLKRFLKNSNYTHTDLDIRDYKNLENIFKGNSFDAIIHTAAQPSHDKAREIPLLDFEVNALGTLNLLELTKQYAQKAVFIFTSTNKVYGDNPNKIGLRENKKRYVFKDKLFVGFNELTPVDHTTHSLFGASKLSADICVQEYGKYFGLKTTCLRLGCITGQAHSGVKLHGFLSYLIKSLKEKKSYEIIGYNGKQVRDQIHAYDLAAAFEQIIKKPGVGEVFNLGGGSQNTISVLEAIELVSKKINIEPKLKYTKANRIGDHICYISDIRKFQKRYPKWKLTQSIEDIVNEQL
ncbi:MAG: NAD-dependent epimerase [Patescibacteria group bacterium]|nr:MAG: NAD-dependent epimerase [Patescibacteria group bacterium]